MGYDRTMKELENPHTSKKLEIAKNIIQLLQVEKEGVPISKFLELGYSKKTVLDTIELINWTLDTIPHGESIKTSHIGERMTVIKLANKYGSS